VKILLNTAVPSIAAALHVAPLSTNVALTIYTSSLPVAGASSHEDVSKPADPT